MEPAPPLSAIVNEPFVATYGKPKRKYSRREASGAISEVTEYEDATFRFFNRTTGEYAMFFLSKYDWVRDKPLGEYYQIQGVIASAVRTVVRLMDTKKAIHEVPVREYALAQLRYHWRALC